MLSFVLIFLSFFQVGLLGIGGYASAQALLEHEVVTLHHWLTTAQFADLMVFCRMLPGGVGLNTATLSSAMVVSGNWGIVGSIVASVIALTGLCVPSCLWTAFYSHIQKREKYKDFFDCAMVVLRPLVPGLIIAAALMLMRADVFTSLETTPWTFGVSVFLCIATLIGTGIYRFNALFLVLLCGVAGWILL